ncbi:MAG: hypothetical protein ACO251_07590, partial [Ilumatobacteraceae bacterium]
KKASQQAGRLHKFGRGKLKEFSKYQLARRLQAITSWRAGALKKHSIDCERTMVLTPLPH